MRKERLVVIGNGMSGARLTEEVLARGGGEIFEIAIFSEETYGNYNRTLLSSILAGTQPQDILINSVEWYEQNGIKLHLGVRAERIDRAVKAVCGSNGVVEPYDKLVIATGSSPLIPAVAGAYTDGGLLRGGLFVFRTPEDCQEIASYAATCHKVAVLGGGLLGLEAAGVLSQRGLEVHVVHLGPHLMDTQIDPHAGAILQQSLEHNGLHIHLEKKAVSFLGNARVVGLAFDDGSSLECDMVVICAGVRPNVGLARQAGLTVEHGIVVGDDLSCLNDPAVFAVGECAQHDGKTYGLVAPLWQQGRVLAERLTGLNTQAVYRGSKVSTRLKVDGIDLVCMGESKPSQGDEVVQYSEASGGIFKRLVIRHGRLIGAVLLGDAATAPALRQLFQDGGELPADRAELLFSLAAKDKAPKVAEIPDTTQVCNCNGVSKGEIVASVKAGNRSLKAVCDATRAGTGCGSCKSLVQAIVELAADGLTADDPAMHYYVPGVPMAKPDLIKACKEQGLRSVSAVFSALTGGEEDPGSKMGLASLLKTIWGEEYDDERDARFINDRLHANIQKDGTFSVVPRIYGGVITPEQLGRLASVAERHKVPMVKITGGQRIALLGVPREKLPAVWRDLAMPSGHAYTRGFRTCKTCVGTDFCRYGLGDSLALGIKIENKFQGIETPHKIKLATSGCPRNCSEATTKDLGAVAIEGGKWEVYVGGGAASRVRKGNLFCVVSFHYEVLKYMGRFIQYYREQARYQERAYDFVERVGVERLRRLLLDDAEGICQGLDAEIQEAVDAYVDPWKEGANPVHPHQFAGILTSI